jgi:hypothetical protein
MPKLIKSCRAKEEEEEEEEVPAELKSHSLSVCYVLCVLATALVYIFEEPYSKCFFSTTT